MAINYFDGVRGNPGSLVTLNNTAGMAIRCVIPAVTMVDQTGAAVGSGTAASPTYTQSAPLPAGTDRSGTAGTAATTLATANPNRRGLTIQNISANNIGINEVGGTAAIGTAGTYTLAAGGRVNVSTNQAISVIASAASSAYTATEF